MTKFHEDMSREKFFYQWFGLIGGRELGWNTYPHRNWTDNPNDLIKFIKACESSHEAEEFCRPCWITAQPFRHIRTDTNKYGSRKIGEAMAIEKLFFDFDDDTKYCEQCKKYIKKDDLIKDKKEKGSFCPHCKFLCEEKPRLSIVGESVIKFVKKAILICKNQRYKFSPEPFIVKTRKGYHVYFFLVDIMVFSKSKIKFAKALYKEMQEVLIGGVEYEFLDKKIVGDISRFARVPLTMHEKTGKICEIVDINLRTTKVRSIDFFKIYGIPDSFVKTTITKLKKRLREQHQKQKEEIEKFEKESIQNGRFYKNEIRPCFKVRMEKGEMNHAQRLAWLAEIYHNGYNTEWKMLELCRKTFNDFIERKSMEQIEDYFKHERYNYSPYKCKTIMAKGWCLYDKCPLWNAKNTKRNANK